MIDWYSLSLVSVLSVLVGFIFDLTQANERRPTPRAVCMQDRIYVVCMCFV